MTSINVRPGIESTHDISLSDGVDTWGFRLEGGMAGMQEVSMVPSTLKFTPGGQRYGDFEPGMSHIEQRTWSGGRGQEDFFDDPSRYFDSMNAWTLADGKLLPTLQWHITRAHDGGVQYLLPGDMTWKPLLGKYTYLSTYFTVDADYTVDRAYFWVRRVGTPGTLTVELCKNNGGNPGDVLKTGTVDTTNITDVISVFQAFGEAWNYGLTVSGAGGAIGPTYHLRIYGDQYDNNANHWEVGVDLNSPGGRSSADGSSYATEQFRPYFYAAPVWSKSTQRFFRMGTTLFRAATSDGGTSGIAWWNPDDKDWVTLSPGGVMGTIKDVVVFNNIAYFAQGSGKDMMKMQWSTDHWAFAADTGNKADALCVFFDPTDGPRIYKALSDTAEVKRADKGAWTSPLNFTDPIIVGDPTFDILAIRGYDDKVYVRKTDSLWAIKGKQYNKVNIGLDAILDTYGVMTDQNLYLYFSYGHSVERFYPGTLDDIGPNKGTGLPTGRSGVVSCLQPLYGLLLVGMNAGSGTSSILAWDGKGYHEIFRAPGANMPVRSMYWDDVLQRLWFSCGGWVMYMDFPKYTLNPLMDETVQYMHEATLITSSIDMGWAEIYKFFKELSMRSKNLDTNITVALDYQTDREIGGNVWNEVEPFVVSPRDVIRINRGRKLAIRFRLRLVTNDATVPPVVIATVLKGFARTPTKRQWNIKIKTSSLQTTRTGDQDVNPDELYNWLWKACQEAGGVRMRTTTTTNDDTWVVVEPPTVIRKSVMAVQKMWSGTFILTLREM